MFDSDGSAPAHSLSSSKASLGRGRSENRKRSQSPRGIIEQLEDRIFLSTTNTSGATTNVRDLTNGPMAKAGGQLVNLYLTYRDAQKAKTLADFNKIIAKAKLGNLLDISGKNVGVQLKAVGSLTTFAKAMKKLGIDVRSSDPADNVIAGYVPITLLNQLAQRSDVSSITPLYKSSVFSQGSANNQAETALSAALARTQYGTTGLGIKVGVISDSISVLDRGNGLQQSVDSGDLPNNVDVLTDGVMGDTDEGRAILEEIYDLAPGASLLFASGDGGQQSFADAITSLKNAGAKVIIDDLGYFEEPYFQPGVIEDAIDAAVNAGVTYISAAGNDANSGFFQAATFVAGQIPGGQNGYLVNFNASGSTPATKMTITVTEAGLLVFEWDDAYDGVAGAVNADLDFYLYNAAGNTLVASSTDNNFATASPWKASTTSSGPRIRSKSPPRTRRQRTCRGITASPARSR